MHLFVIGQATELDWIWLPDHSEGIMKQKLGALDGCECGCGYGYTWMNAIISNLYFLQDFFLNINIKSISLLEQEEEFKMPQIMNRI